MQVFDTSSMIYAWDNYPIDQFPGVWEWMANEVESGQLQMSEVAVDEVGHKVPECAEWLKDHKLQKLSVDEAILKEALRYKVLLGIEEDKYHPKGVDENDLLIIATAMRYGDELISNEGIQADVPKQKAKYKIPAVCKMKDVNVACLDFLDYIKRSGIVFR